MLMGLAIASSGFYLIYIRWSCTQTKQLKFDISKFFGDAFDFGFIQVQLEHIVVYVHTLLSFFSTTPHSTHPKYGRNLYNYISIIKFTIISTYWFRGYI